MVKNADNIEWRTSWGVGTFAGESVTLTFDQKNVYALTVEGTNKRKENAENFEIHVGSYEARVEPRGCDGTPITGDDDFQAYLYASKADIRSDLAGESTSNAIASVDLEYSYYYNGTNNNSTQQVVGGFRNIPSGEYYVYIENTSNKQNNLLDLALNTGFSLLNIQNGQFDDLCYPKVNTNVYGEANDYLKNLIGKTWALNQVWVNDTEIDVSPCNEDDQMTFDMNGTFFHNVGADDCSGEQINSSGAYSFSSSCTNLAGESIYLNPTSGTWEGIGINLRMESVNTFIISYSVESNYVEQKFVAL